MDLYELCHFCGAWLFNDLELPAQDVAHQLGHTDGGALVQGCPGTPPRDSPVNGSSAPPEPGSRP